MIRTPFAALALVSVLMASSAACAAGLSAAEKKMVATAEAENGRQVALLEKMVNINSGTMNFEGVEKVGQVMRGELEPLGFKVDWIPMAAANRAGHIVAVHKGSGKGKRMLLIGHLDTVFEKDSPFQTWKRTGDVVEGPGVNDMKGGLVIMVGALRAMQAAGTLKNADITIVLTGDEERAGSPVEIARKDLIQAAARNDLALDFEGLAEQDGKDMGSIARRSSNTWELTVTAKPGHSSGIFSEQAGYGAVYDLARILDQFRRDLREPNATYNVGLILGGSSAELNAAETGGTATGKPNIIAATAVARGDLRTLSNEQTKRMSEKMAAIVAQNLPGATAKLKFTEGYPAMAPTEGSRKLLGRLNEVNHDLGYAPMAELDPLKRGAGDIAFVADKLDGLIGLGAAGEGSHAPGETLELKSLDRQTKRAAILMSRFARP
ncbi:MAG TPA: M20/M25/M40 family metallo-hydrolase [Phenylobacterium sp.]|nr:M20/M25/M40 family metallo-hydrolase [Phenylobacterium sp.]